MVNCGDLVKVAGGLEAVNVDQRASDRTKTWFLSLLLEQRLPAVQR